MFSLCSADFSTNSSDRNVNNSIDKRSLRASNLIKQTTSFTKAVTRKLFKSLATSFRTPNWISLYPEKKVIITSIKSSKWEAFCAAASSSVLKQPKKLLIQMIRLRLIRKPFDCLLKISSQLTSDEDNFFFSQYRWEVLVNASIIS